MAKMWLSFSEETKEHGLIHHSQLVDTSRDHARETVRATVQLRSYDYGEAIEEAGAEPFYSVTVISTHGPSPKFHSWGMPQNAQESD